MRTFTIALLVALAARAAAAQEPDTARHRGADRLKFLGGATLAFASHESGHLGFDVLFDAGPHITPVHFGPIPFFSISHHKELPRAQLYATTAAGFWIQAATNEWILSRHPRLRDEHRPMLKGAVMFNVLMPAGYALAGAFGIGPPERDPRTMAEAARVRAPVACLFVFVPAVLDGYRYLHPGARWPVWVSRAFKLGSVALTLHATSR